MIDMLNKLEEFLDYLTLEKGYSRETIKAYALDLKYFFNDFPIITEDSLESYLKLLSSKGLKRSSIERKIFSLKAFLKFVCLRGYEEGQLWSKLRSIKKEKRLPRPLKMDEVERIFSQATLRERAIFRTLYDTGIRVSELVGIQIKDIDFSEGFLKVKGKGSVERLVPISKALTDILEEYINDIGIKDGYLFTEKDSLIPLTRQSIFLILKNLVEKAGVKRRISPHMFRHTFATRLLRGGADLRTVQEILGHKNITTTQIYTQVEDGALRRAYLNAHPLSQNRKPTSSEKNDKNIPEQGEDDE